MPTQYKSHTQETIARQLAQIPELGVNLDQARVVMAHAIQSMRDALLHGCDVKLSGLVALKLQKRGVRKHRNPRTGEYFTAPPRTVVRAVVSRDLSEQVRRDTAEAVEHVDA